MAANENEKFSCVRQA